MMDIGEKKKKFLSTIAVGCWCLSRIMIHYKEWKKNLRDTQRIHIYFFFFKEELYVSRCMV